VTTVVPNRQVERSERSTVALLDAAAALIVEGGFSSMTFAAIGERAGYSRGLVTARFGSKEGLVEALLRRIVGRWSHHNVLPRTEGRSGLDGLLVIFDAVRAQAERDPRGLRVLSALMFEAGQNEVLRARFATFHDTMRGDIEALLQRGRDDRSIAAGVDVAAEAALLVGALRGIGYQWLIDPDGFDPVPPLRYLVKTMPARLAARPVTAQGAP
jgi:AcrR family transcriptional regulator